MTYLLLIYEFCKVGLFSIGGGMATIPFLMDLAKTRPWFTPDQLTDMIAIACLLYTSGNSYRIEQGPNVTLLPNERIPYDKSFTLSKTTYSVTGICCCAHLLHRYLRLEPAYADV